MNSGPRATSKVPRTECIVSKGIVYKAFTPKEAKGKVRICLKELYHSEF